MVRGAISEILKSQLDPCQGRGGTLGAVAGQEQQLAGLHKGHEGRSGRSHWGRLKA